jgi:hypothetical protein
MSALNGDLRDIGRFFRATQVHPIGASRVARRDQKKDQRQEEQWYGGAASGTSK